MSSCWRVPLNTVVTTSVFAFRSAWSTVGVWCAVTDELSEIPAHPAEKIKADRNKKETAGVLDVEFVLIIDSEFRVNIAREFFLKLL
jgi:hypothetical protein